MLPHNLNSHILGHILLLFSANCSVCFTPWISSSLSSCPTQQCGSVFLPKWPQVPGTGQAICHPICSMLPFTHTYFSYFLPLNSFELANLPDKVLAMVTQADPGMYFQSVKEEQIVLWLLVIRSVKGKREAAGSRRHLNQEFFKIKVKRDASRRIRDHAKEKPPPGRNCRS